ncbi:MAG TPA: ATP-binding protein [Thermoleophilia bacterium]|nr:ATP-binding protein [Thermoleophilia bacterium]
MDPRENPFTPNAGARPPLLAGRDDELNAFDLLLARLARGRPQQSMIITGLRGVGKTVLLGEFRALTEEHGWIAVEAEITRQTEFAQRMALLARRALLQVAPRARWRERARRAAGVLRSFTLTVSAEGAWTAGLDLDPVEGEADSGLLADDLTDVFVTLGEAAQEHETGVVFLLDEMQFLDAEELEALIAALHKTVQRALPITLAGAGLPLIPRLAGEAKSYAERLFTFPVIGRLPNEEATRALVEPVHDAGAAFEPEAVAEIIAYAEGYPYFIQEYGGAAWDASPSPVIARHVVEEVSALVDAKLDAGFFRVRAERAAPHELRYLRAMAGLGPGPHKANAVAAALGVPSARLAPTRSRLIEKGLLYTPGYGLAAFTVPQFDRYLLRNYAVM